MFRYVRFWTETDGEGEGGFGNVIRNLYSAGEESGFHKGYGAPIAISVEGDRMHTGSCAQEIEKQRGDVQDHS
jgi:hypothetical protein